MNVHLLIIQPLKCFDLFQKLSKAKACADTGLLDVKLFQRCLQFFSSVSAFCLKMMTGQNPDVIAMPLDPEACPTAFAALPEWIIEDLIDFLVFSLQ